MSLQEDYNEFKSMLSNGLELQGHSGLNGPSDVTVFTVEGFYDHDEIMCEEEWNNYHTDCLVSIIEILTDQVRVNTYEFDTCLDSFTNGNFKQFIDQVMDLDMSDFTDFLKDSVDTYTEIKVLRYLVNNL